MFGRKRLFEAVCRYLTQDTPPHISVVGPKLYGKTVLLKHLADHFTGGRDRYITAIFWDLRHDTPASDDAFRRRFAEMLRTALQTVNSDKADYLDLEEETLSDLIELTFQDLEQENRAVLVVLDGFDAVPLGTTITHNILSQMRAWAERRSLRFVIGSRSTLQDLCKSEDTRDSDFWRIFMDPIQIGRFDEEDWADILSPFEEKNIRFETSAAKELINWTGGVPILTAALLGRLFDESPDGHSLAGDHINQFSESNMDRFQSSLKDLWNECTVEMQTDLSTLSKSELAESDIASRRREELERRGFIVCSRNRIRSACRLLERYANQEAGGITDMRRLFGDAERYASNIQRFLELRLSHIQGIDPELRGLVEKSIRNLQPSPPDSLTWMRRIADRALDLIWQMELPQSRSLPDAWIEQWKHTEELRGSGKVNQEILNRILPRRRSGQCRLLNLVTGTQNTPSIGRYVTKSTYLLVDYLQSIGDFGQHLDEGARVDLGFAASVCLSAIELCESWKRDMER